MRLVIEHALMHEGTKTSVTSLGARPFLRRGRGKRERGLKGQRRLLLERKRSEVQHFRVLLECRLIMGDL